MGINPPRDAARAEPDPYQDQTSKQKAKQMTDIDEEFYDDVQDEFPSVGEDLIVGAHSGLKAEIEGRLVAVWPRENGKSQGRNGGTFDWCDAVVLVLDDGPDGTMFTDKIGRAPVEEKLRFSTTGTFARIGPRLEGMTKAKKDDDGNVLVPARPAKYVPLIGRINARPAKEKGNNPPISIRLMTPEEKSIAERYKAEIKAISAKLKAKDEEKEDAQAFG